MSEFSGGFIDSDDADGLVRWAQKMCRGLDVEATAEIYGVPPTIDSVARAVVGNITDDDEIQRQVVRACEVELGRAEEG
jgi:hypothetical protein